MLSAHEVTPPLVLWDFECKTNHIVTLPVLWPKLRRLYSKPSRRLCHLHTNRDVSSLSCLDAYAQQEQNLSSLSPYQGTKYRRFKASAILRHVNCWSWNIPKGSFRPSSHKKWDKVWCSNKEIFLPADSLRDHSFLREDNNRMGSRRKRRTYVPKNALQNHPASKTSA